MCLARVFSLWYTRCRCVPIFHRHGTAQCVCRDGWSGAACDVAVASVDFGCTSDADCCGGHGHTGAAGTCLRDVGACACAPGYAGRNCEVAQPIAEWDLAGTHTRRHACGGFWELGSQQCQCRANSTGVECRASLPAGADAAPMCSQVSGPGGSNTAIIVVIVCFAVVVGILLLAAAGKVASHYLCADEPRGARGSRSGGAGGTGTSYIAMSPTGARNV